MSDTWVNGAALTIRRPDGTIETIINNKQAIGGVIPPRLFAQMVAATKSAGRGQILSQRPNVVPVTPALKREELVGRIQDRADAFPGSREWTEARGYEQDLEAFDRAHPEIIAQINADRAARTAVGVATALKMAD